MGFDPWPVVRAQQTVEVSLSGPRWSQAVARLLAAVDEQMMFPVCIRGEICDCVMLAP